MSGERSPLLVMHDRIEIRSSLLRQLSGGCLCGNEDQGLRYPQVIADTLMADRS